MEVKPIGDKKRAFELSPIVKISLTLYFATSPEGGSFRCGLKFSLKEIEHIFGSRPRVRRRVKIYDGVIRKREFHVLFLGVYTI